MVLSSQRRIAAEILKTGVSRVKILDEKEVSEAITRADVRNLIRKGMIVKVQKKGPSRFYSRKTAQQKKKGRRRGIGSKKGARYAVKSRKTQWVDRVRPLRGLLTDLVKSGQVDKNQYRKLYLMIKGGSFRNKKHLLYYLKEHEMLKKTEKSEKPDKKVKSEVKKRESHAKEEKRENADNSAQKEKVR
jgi:large subunit ribosomal protein L19e